MAFNDSQELRRVCQVLSECSPEQIVQLLREAHMGVIRTDRKNVFTLNLQDIDDSDDDDDD